MKQFSDDKCAVSIKVSSEFWTSCITCILSNTGKVVRNSIACIDVNQMTLISFPLQLLTMGNLNSQNSTNKSFILQSHIIHCAFTVHFEIAFARSLHSAFAHHSKVEHFRDCKYIQCTYLFQISTYNNRCHKEKLPVYMSCTQSTSL